MIVLFLFIGTELEALVMARPGVRVADSKKIVSFL